MFNVAGNLHMVMFDRPIPPPLPTPYSPPPIDDCSGKAFWLAPDFGDKSNMRDPGCVPFWCRDMLRDGVVATLETPAVQLPSNKCLRVYPGYACRISHICVYRDPFGEWWAVNPALPFTADGGMQTIEFWTDADPKDFTVYW